MTCGPKWVGISKHGKGFRAAVSRGKSRPKVYAFFPAGTSLETMQNWRADQQAGERLARKTRASKGTFEGDAHRYLRAVQALTTFQERELHIRDWITVFGTMRREAITAVDIREQRDKWLTQDRPKTGRRGTGPLSPHSVNLRLRALSNLWTVLDGRRAANPVREVPEAPEPKSLPRALEPATVRRILDALPDRGFRAKNSNPKRDGERPSLAKARLIVLATTGWPPAVLMKMSPERIDWRRRLATLPGRHKGYGTGDVVRPLTTQAVSALQHLDAVNGWGAFNYRNVVRAFQATCRRLGLTGLTPYMFRHTFLTALAMASKDERAVQAAAQHRSIATTRLYTEASVDPRIMAAYDAMANRDDIMGRPSRTTAENTEQKRTTQSRPTSATGRTKR